MGAATSKLIHPTAGDGEVFPVVRPPPAGVA
jgi:hypothetical protein